MAGRFAVVFPHDADHDRHRLAERVLGYLGAPVELRQGMTESGRGSRLWRQGDRDSTGERGVV